MYVLPIMSVDTGFAHDSKYQYQLVVLTPFLTCLPTLVCVHVHVHVLEIWRLYTVLPDVSWFMVCVCTLFNRKVSIAWQPDKKPSVILSFITLVMNVRYIIVQKKAKNYHDFRLHLVACHTALCTRAVI